MCPTCKAKSKHPSGYCNRCETRRNKVATWLTKGRCTKCGGKRDGEKSQCRTCREAYKERRNARFALRAKKGGCVWCGKPAVTGGAQPGCFHCWVRVEAIRAGVGKDWRELLKMWKAQKGRCAFTGVKLIVGGRFLNSATIDHKIARAHGGPDTIENLHWVSLTANRAKHTTDHVAFLKGTK